MAEQVSSPDAFPVPNASLDSDALACWDLAGWIGLETSDDHLRSFTSLLIALLHGESPLSRWFLRYARAVGIKLDEIYKSRGFKPAILPKLRERRSRGETLSGSPPYTTSATNIANGAVGLAAQTGRNELGVRHLLGAYFYANPKDHEGQLQKWGFDGQRDGSAFVRQMHERYPDEDAKWIDIHTKAIGQAPDLTGRDPAPPAPVSGFAADTPEGKDYLDIEDDYYALSALICSTKITPPLSIGLFGDWGSGKSFFMHRLRRGAAWISQHARNSNAMQRDLPFYKYVVQIEFNAWNYSAGNLWAALVQHILENLRLTEQDDEELVARRLAYLRSEMQLEQRAREAARAREQEARKTAEVLNEKLESLRKEHDEEVERLKAVLTTDVLKTVQLDQGTTDELNGIREELGLPEASAEAGEFLAAVDGARQLLHRTSALVRYVPEHERLRFFVASVLVIVVPPLVAFLIGWVVHQIAQPLGSISAAVSWISASLGFGAHWLRDRSRALEKPLAELERLQVHARQRVEAEERKHRAEAAELEQRIALAKDEIVAAQARQQEAVARQEQIAAQVAATTPASVLADFVRERSGSEDYRRYLGLPAVIRRDFESISRLVSEENRRLADANEIKSLEDEEKGAEQRVSRIVLYIDDLDRCPEPLVVEVLQAVHLLLAFPLFVVVVAVDARWMSRSLARHFPGLLSDGPADPSGPPAAAGTDHATPNDYLEKIFQIPFWIRQPGNEAVKRMVRGLVGESAAGEPTPHPTPGAGPDGDGVVRPDQGTVFKYRQHDPRAASLDIRQEERAYMEQLAPLLGAAPRAQAVRQRLPAPEGEPAAGGVRCVPRTRRCGRAPLPERAVAARSRQRPAGPERRLARRARHRATGQRDDPASPGDTRYRPLGTASVE